MVEHTTVDQDYKFGIDLSFNLAIDVPEEELKRLNQGFNVYEAMNIFDRIDSDKIFKELAKELIKREAFAYYLGHLRSLGRRFDARLILKAGAKTTWEYLDYSFTWSNTSLGHGFWAAIYNSLVDQAGKPGLRRL